MNDRFDSTRYALDDDQLDGVLAGREPGGPGVEPGNPVVEFFAEARQTRFAGEPTPSPELQAMFAASAAPAPAPAPTPAVDPAGADTTLAAEGTVTAAVPATATPSPSGDGPSPLLPPTGPNTEELQAVFVSARGPSWDESGGGTPPPVPTVRPLPPTRPSTLATIGAVLRPTPSKILVGVSLVLAAFIGGAVLGLIDIPGDGSQNVAGVESTLSPLSTTSTTAALAEDQAAPAARPTTTIAISTSRPTDPPPLTTPTTEALTTTTVETTTASSETTASTEAPTTTTEAPTTEPSDPETSETTDTTETPTSTVPTSETTLPPTSTTLTTIEVITPGRNLAVPDDLQAGTYAAPVEGARVCNVNITYAEGNTDEISVEPGNAVVFSLFEGSVVRTTQGCPQIFTVISG